MSHIGERIKEYRERKNIPIARIVNLTKISKPTLWRYETGETNPDSDFLSKFVKGFPVRAFWLLTGEGEMDWKGKTDDEFNVVLEKILKNKNAQKTLFHFIRWQESIHEKKELTKKEDPIS